MKSLLMVLAWAALLLAPATPTAQPPVRLNWYDTGLTITGSPLYLDATHPGVVFAAEPARTVVYNWQTGERMVLSQHTFNRCGCNGLLFDVPDRQGSPFDGPTWRFRTTGRWQKPGRAGLRQ